MKKYIQIIGITLIIFTMTTIVFPFSKVYGAASASIKASNNTIYVGESTKITVSVNATETWSLGITSKGGTLSGTTQNADAAGGEVSQQVISCNFTANTAGTYTITLSGTVASTDDVNNRKKQTVNKTVNITVKNKEQTPVTPPSNNNDNIPQETKPGTTTTKSSNNYLSSLKISEGKLNPEFNFRTYKYTVDVGEEINSIKITAGAEHNKAKVSGTGTKTLKPGENKFNITVKAEDGKERTYTIIVNKPSEEEKVLLKSLKLQGVKLEEEKVELSYSPEFSSEVYEYSVNVANDITKIDVEAIASKEDYTVEITGNEELKEGENIITILVKAKDSDKVTTYKIKVIKEKAVEAVATLDETSNTKEELKDNNIIKIVIVTFTALVAIAGIVFAVIEYNYSKKHPKEKMGKIPYSNIGFKDEETDKEDILEEQEDKKEKDEKEESKDEEDNAEENKPKKRGKHF